MANSSRTFYIIVGGLAASVAVLASSLYFQRQAAAESYLAARLDADIQRLTLLDERTKPLIEKQAEVQARRESLAAEFAKRESRLYKADEQKALEAMFSQVASAARFDVEKIENGGTNTTDAYKEHVFHIRMLGPIGGISAWAEAVNRQNKVVVIDRISVVSPEYQTSRARIKGTVRVFEALTPEKVGGEEFPATRLDIALDYQADKDPASVPYGEKLTTVRTLAQSLGERKPALIAAAQEERLLSGYTKLVDGLNKADAEAKTNRKLVVDKLPTLASRFQTSTLGSAALLISAGEARFPEVAVDD
ncbi:MAG: type 4a pilus biogenesis protein PilO [Myxococcota bacterium]